MFVLLIPLNQGLKPGWESNLTSQFRIVCFADSIKSRIETDHYYGGYAECQAVCFADSIKSRIETGVHSALLWHFDQVCFADSIKSRIETL